MPKYVEIRCQCGVSYQTNQVSSMCPGCYKKHHTPGLGGMSGALGSLFRAVYLAYKGVKDPEVQASIEGMKYHRERLEKNLKNWCKYHPEDGMCKRRNMK